MAQAQDDNEARLQRAKRFKIFGAVLAVSAVVGGGYWGLTHNRQNTDDAYVDADVVQIAPQVGGPVTGLHFSDNQWVEKGQLLVEIDPRDFQVALESAKAAVDVAQAQAMAAEADLALTRTTSGAAVNGAGHAVSQAGDQVSEAQQQAIAAKADATRAQADVKRYEELAKSTFASRQRYEQALADSRSTNARWRAAEMAASAAEAQRAQSLAKLTDAQAAPSRVAQKEAQLAVAQAQLEQAQAAWRQAELNLSYTRIAAPQAGRIARRAVRLGDVVQKNQNLASLVTEPLWVVANFKETQLNRMRPGQPVAISIDAYPDHDFAGRIDSIQPGSGSRFSLLPAENATGNFVKVVQRVPVKILFDNPGDPLLRQLAPGMSVAPVVDVGIDPGAK